MKLALRVHRVCKRQLITIDKLTIVGLELDAQGSTTARPRRHIGLLSDVDSVQIMEFFRDLPTELMLTHPVRARSQVVGELSSFMNILFTSTHARKIPRMPRLTIDDAQ